MSPDHVDLAGQVQRVEDVYELILHHTGDETTPQGVETLHRRNADEWQVVRDVSGVLSLDKIGGPQSFRYSDVGYHFLIDEDGTIYAGRNIRYQGAHVGGHNENTIGIAFLGDYTNTELPVPALDSLRSLAGELERVAGHNMRISTHGQYSAAKHAELAGAMDQIYEIRRRHHFSHR